MADQSETQMGEIAPTQAQGQPQPQTPPAAPYPGQSAGQPPQGAPYAGQPAGQQPQGAPYAGQPAGQPPQGAPYAGQSAGQPPQGAPYAGQPAGQPPQGAPYAGQPAGQAFPAHLAGPPGYFAGQPQPSASAYPPPPPGPQPVQASALGPLAQNLPQQQVTWMTPPTDAPSGCPLGLEYLTHIDQVLVHQQIEIFELVTNFETQNKYRIRNTLGQQIYFAAEESSVLQRQFCGPGRAFSMSITDNSNKEVIRLERPLRYYCNCSGLTCYCCCSCCIPNTIEVQAPPGTVVGYVKQEALGILRPWFSIQNADGETLLRIKGPVLGCACYADANFEVLSADAQQNVGRISKQWGGLAREYFTDADNFGIQFPMDLDVKMKAVMLGAVFLIDFMFFETAGGGGANRHHRRHY